MGWNYLSISKLVCAKTKGCFVDVFANETRAVSLCDQMSYLQISQSLEALRFTPRYCMFNTPFVPEKFCSNLRSIIFTLISKIYIYIYIYINLGDFLWNCPQIDAKRPHWCQRTLLTISQHWFRYMLCVVSQRAITWTNADQVFWRHMASLGHKELSVPNAKTLLKDRRLIIMVFCKFGLSASHERTHRSLVMLYM